MLFDPKKERDRKQKKGDEVPFIFKKMTPAELREIMKASEGFGEQSFAIRESSIPGMITADTCISDKKGSTLSYRFALINGAWAAVGDINLHEAKSKMTPMSGEDASKHAEQLLEAIHKVTKLPKSNLIKPNASQATENTAYTGYRH